MNSSQQQSKKQKSAGAASRRPSRGTTAATSTATATTTVKGEEERIIKRARRRKKEKDKEKPLKSPSSSRLIEPLRLKSKSSTPTAAQQGVKMTRTQMGKRKSSSSSPSPTKILPGVQNPFSSIFEAMKAPGGSFKIPKKSTKPEKIDVPQKKDVEESRINHIQKSSTSSKKAQNGTVTSVTQTVSNQSQYELRSSTGRKRKAEAKDEVEAEVVTPPALANFTTSTSPRSKKLVENSLIATAQQELAQIQKQVPKVPQLTSPPSSTATSASTSPQPPEGTVSFPSPTLTKSLLSSSRSVQKSPPVGISPGRKLEAVTGHTQASIIHSYAGTDEIEAMEIENLVPAICELVSSSSDGITAGKELQVFQDEMEVDAVLQTKRHFIIIPDTNVWVGESRNLIREILDMRFPAFPSIRLLVIIPWMVLQEIDYNIHHSKAAFRHAAKFIHGLLSSKNPHVKGQKATEALIGGCDFTEIMADDSILNCALQYTAQPQHLTTVFLTNDINLLNKALVNNVTAFKPESDLKRKLHQIVESRMNEAQEAIASSPAWNPQAPIDSFSAHSSISSQSENQSVSTTNDEDFAMDVDDPMDGTISQEPDLSVTTALQAQVPPQSNSRTSSTSTCTFDAVVDSLQQALSCIIIPSMMKEYGRDDWKVATKILPPYSVESALKCIQVHWIAVFSFVFPQRRAKLVLDQLLTLFQKRRTHGRGANNNNAITGESGIQAVGKEIVTLSLQLFSFTKNFKSTERILECCRIMQEYLQANDND